MTPKLKMFFSEGALPTPYLAVDLDRVAKQYRRMVKAMPWAKVFYAVKANPAAPILKTLVRAKAGFDAASIEEVRQCLAAGCAPSNISYGNPIKKSASIAEAASLGIKLFVCDSEEELQKIAQHAPGAKIYTRLGVDNEGADWPLSQKFGASAKSCASLLCKAPDLGLIPYGVSFHVGSQQGSPAAYLDAIHQAARIFQDVAMHGIKLTMLNIGGGFPVQYRAPVPEIERFAAEIDAALTAAFGVERPFIMSEPGRYLVAEAGIVCSEVVLNARRELPGQEGDWLYLDIGRFGGLAETEDEAIRYDIVSLRQQAPQRPFVLAGPTCDGVDIIYRKNKVSLPSDLREGDRVALLAAGAYVSTYSSQGFNGFAPLSEHYI